jgi:hypothetical protein
VAEILIKKQIMIMQIDRETKIGLLQSLKTGYSDTAKIPVLNETVTERQPARVPLAGIGK